MAKREHSPDLNTFRPQIKKIIRERDVDLIFNPENIYNKTRELLYTGANSMLVSEKISANRSLSVVTQNPPVSNNNYKQTFLDNNCQLKKKGIEKKLIKECCSNSKIVCSFCSSLSCNSCLLCCYFCQENVCQPCRYIMSANTEEICVCMSCFPAKINLSIRTDSTNF